MLLPTEYNSADACKIDINTNFADYYVYLSQLNFSRFKAVAHFFSGFTGGEELLN